MTGCGFLPSPFLALSEEAGIAAFDHDVKEAVAPYKNSHGEVSSGDMEVFLDAGEGVCVRYKAAGVISDFTREKDSIIVEFPSGLTYQIHAFRKGCG